MSEQLHEVSPPEGWVRDGSSAQCTQKALAKVCTLRYILQCFDTRCRQTLFDLAEGWRGCRSSSRCPTPVPSVGSRCGDRAVDAGARLGFSNQCERRRPSNRRRHGGSRRPLLHAARSDCAEPRDDRARASGLVPGPARRLRVGPGVHPSAFCLKLLNFRLCDQRRCDRLRPWSAGVNLLQHLSVLTSRRYGGSKDAPTNVPRKDPPSYDHTR